MFGQIFSLLVSYLFGRMNQSSEHQGWLATLSMAAVRRAFVLLSAAILGVLIFVGGFFTVLTDLILSSRGTDGLYVSNVSAVGFGLILISGLGMILATRKALWQQPAQQKIEVEEKASPLNEALASLVMDFVEERRAGRVRPEADYRDETPERARTETPPVYM